MNAPQSDNPFAAGAAYIDGRYMPIGQAAIPITDWGYRRSDVTYDVVGVWEGNFFRLEDHIRRFRSSMRKFRFEPRRKRRGHQGDPQPLRRSVRIEKRLRGDGLPPRSPRARHALSSRPCPQLHRSLRHSLGLGDESRSPEARGSSHHRRDPAHTGRFRRSHREEFPLGRPHPRPVRSARSGSRLRAPA